MVDVRRRRPRGRCRELDGFVIPQRTQSGYVNATSMCKAAGWVANYTRMAATRLLLMEVAEALTEDQGSMGIPIDP